MILYMYWFEYILCKRMIYIQWMLTVKRIRIWKFFSATMLLMIKTITFPNSSIQFLAKERIISGPCTRSSTTPSTWPCTGPWPRPSALVTPIYQISMPSLASSSHWVWVYSYWILNVKRAPEMASIFDIRGLYEILVGTILKTNFRITTIFRRT